MQEATIGSVQIGGATDMTPADFDTSETTTVSADDLDELFADIDEALEDPDSEDPDDDWVEPPVSTGGPREEGDQFGDQTQGDRNEDTEQSETGSESGVQRSVSQVDTEESIGGEAWETELAQQSLSEAEFQEEARDRIVDDIMARYDAGEMDLSDHNERAIATFLTELSPANRRNRLRSLYDSSSFDQYGIRAITGLRQIFNEVLQRRHDYQSAETYTENISRSQLQEWDNADDIYYRIDTRGRREETGWMGERSYLDRLAEEVVNEQVDRFMNRENLDSYDEQFLAEFIADKYWDLDEGELPDDEILRRDLFEHFGEDDWWVDNEVHDILEERGITWSDELNSYRSDGVYVVRTAADVANYTLGGFFGAGADDVVDASQRLNQVVQVVRGTDERRPPQFDHVPDEEFWGEYLVNNPEVISEFPAEMLLDVMIPDGDMTFGETEDLRRLEDQRQHRISDDDWKEPPVSRGGPPEGGDQLGDRADEGPDEVFDGQNRLIRGIMREYWADAMDEMYESGIDYLHTQYERVTGIDFAEDTSTENPEVMENRFRERLEYLLTTGMVNSQSGLEEWRAALDDATQTALGYLDEQGISYNWEDGVQRVHDTINTEHNPDRMNPRHLEELGLEPPEQADVGPITEPSAERSREMYMEDMQELEELQDARGDTGNITSREFNVVYDLAVYRVIPQVSDENVELLRQEYRHDEIMDVIREEYGQSSSLSMTIEAVVDYLEQGGTISTQQIGAVDTGIMSSSFNPEGSGEMRSIEDIEAEFADAPVLTEEQRRNPFSEEDAAQAEMTLDNFVETDEVVYVDGERYFSPRGYIENLQDRVSDELNLESLFPQYPDLPQNTWRYALQAVGSGIRQARNMIEGNSPYIEDARIVLDFLEQRLNDLNNAIAASVSDYTTPAGRQNLARVVYAYNQWRALSESENLSIQDQEREHNEYEILYINIYDYLGNRFEQLTGQNFNNHEQYDELMEELDNYIDPEVDFGRMDIEQTDHAQQEQWREMLNRALDNAMEELDIEQTSEQTSVPAWQTMSREERRAAAQDREATGLAEPEYEATTENPNYHPLEAYRQGRADMAAISLDPQDDNYDMQGFADAQRRADDALATMYHIHMTQIEEWSLGLIGELAGALINRREVHEGRIIGQLHDAMLEYYNENGYTPQNRVRFWNELLGRNRQTGDGTQRSEDNWFRQLREALEERYGEPEASLPRRNTNPFSIDTQEAQLA